MSDIPPKAMEMGKFLIDNNDLQKFKKLGSRADLDILRQVNQEYYQALNSTFIDSVAKGIKLIYMGRAVPDFFEPDEAEENMLENNGEAENAEGEEENMENEDSGEDDQLDEMNGDDNENQPSTLLRTNDGYFDLPDWTPKIAHVFRKLELKGSWIVQMKNDDLPLYEIVTQLAPYITTFRLNTLPLDSENPGLKYSEFLNQFTNLKNLEIDIIVQPLHRHNVHGMSIDQVEMGVANLQLRPSITFYAEENHREILAKFGAMKNASFNFRFDLFGLGNNNRIMETVAAIQNNSTLGQIKYSFRSGSGTFRNFNQVKAFTELCVKPQMENQIEKLDLSFNFDARDFVEEDRFGIATCLDQLSPYLTYLYVRLRSKPTWDILNHDLEWPKLTFLWIIGYNYPLEILKKCTNLELMQLEIDQDVCIFHNHQQSEKESLKEYFGNLRHLDGIDFVRGKGEDKIADGNELDEYLKEILPQRLMTRFLDSDVYEDAPGEEDGPGSDLDDNDD